jgi:hypothetical protein
MVFLKRVGEDQDVVEVHRDDAFGDQVMEYLIHHGLECCWTVGEAEVYH